jgi:hypothetical protein
MNKQQREDAERSTGKKAKLSAPVGSLLLMKSNWQNSCGGVNPIDRALVGFSYCYHYFNQRSKIRDPVYLKKLRKHCCGDENDKACTSPDRSICRHGKAMRGHRMVPYLDDKRPSARERTSDIWDENKDFNCWWNPECEELDYRSLEELEAAEAEGFLFSYKNADRIAGPRAGFHAKNVNQCAAVCEDLKVTQRSAGIMPLDND